MVLNLECVAIMDCGGDFFFFSNGAGLFGSIFVCFSGGDDDVLGLVMVTLFSLSSRYRD